MGSKRVMKRGIIALKDIIIPKGTIFEYREGKTEYINGNYDVNIGTGKDTVMHIVISEDELEYGEGNFGKIEQ